MRLEEIVNALKSKGLADEDIKKVLLDLKEEITSFCEGGEPKEKEEKEEKKETEDEFIKRVFGY